MMQFPRRFRLLLADANGEALELTNLNIQGEIRSSGIQAPHIAEIKIFNIDTVTTALIKKEFTRIYIEAGYGENYGVIFDGTVRQYIDGMIDGVDRTLTIMAGEGDESYNFAFINKTLEVGAGQIDVVNETIKSMGNIGGETLGYLNSVNQSKLPRGKVIFRQARESLRQFAYNNDMRWNFNGKKVDFIPNNAYLPTEAVVLTSKTGLIARPQQTIDGIVITSLLNPRIQMNGRVRIENSTVDQYKLDLNSYNTPANTPAPLDYDGEYIVYKRDIIFHTRGEQFYTVATCLNADTTTNYLNTTRLN